MELNKVKQTKNSSISHLTFQREPSLIFDECFYSKEIILLSSFLLTYYVVVCLFHGNT